MPLTSSVPVCKYRPNSMPGRSKERRERLGSFQARSPLLYRQFPWLTFRGLALAGQHQSKQDLQQERSEPINHVCHDYVEGNNLA